MEFCYSWYNYFDFFNNLFSILKQMTLKKTNRTFLIFILIFISLVLISAFTIEYQFDYKPCKLCIYQRIPYFIAFLLITKLFFIQKYERIVFSILSPVVTGTVDFAIIILNFLIYFEISLAN